MPLQPCRVAYAQQTACSCGSCCANSRRRGPHCGGGGHWPMFPSNRLRSKQSFLLCRRGPRCGGGGLGRGGQRPQVSLCLCCWLGRVQCLFVTPFPARIPAELQLIPTPLCAQLPSPAPPIHRYWIIRNSWGTYWVSLFAMLSGLLLQVRGNYLGCTNGKVRFKLRHWAGPQPALRHSRVDRLFAAQLLLAPLVCCRATWASSSSSVA